MSFGNKEVTSKTETCNFNIFEDILHKIYLLGYCSTRKLLITWHPYLGLYWNQRCAGISAEILSLFCFLPAHV